LANVGVSREDDWGSNSERTDVAGVEETKEVSEACPTHDVTVEFEEQLLLRGST